jgi:hypothetical protein
MAAPGSEQAILGITKWARRGEWRERLDLIIDAHFGPVLSLVDLPVEDLPELLGDAFSPLFACVLEDFLTCDFGPDQRSIVADYLKRRGFRERAPAKIYLRALQRSVMSVYQVVLTVPGSHLVLRDLIRGGDPIRVEDRSGASSLTDSDRIAVRLLPIGGKTYLAGGLLGLPADQVPDLVKDIRRLRQRLRRWMAREAEQSGVRVADIEAVIPLDDVLLGELAPIFTHVWLTATLEQRLGLVLTDAGRAESAPEALLTMPLTALGGKSPQQAARSQTGRRQLAQWLKYQESRDPEQVGSDPDVAGADLGWMWQALKIGHLR